MNTCATVYFAALDYGSKFLFEKSIRFLGSILKGYNVGGQ